MPWPLSSPLRQRQRQDPAQPCTAELGNDPRVSIQPFKVGPAISIPSSSAAAGRSCHNLDLNLCGQDWVLRSFHGYGGTADLALVEGVMGLFDGIGSSETGSTAATARLLDLPVVLVVDAGGQAASIGALVRGFRDHDPRLNLAGVVLNRVNSDRHQALLAEVLERLGVPLLGCMPRTDAMALPSRHLGLAPAHELEHPQQRIEAWAALARDHLDLTALEPLLKAPVAGPSPLSDIPSETGIPLPVAVADDAAFHFRYPETSELLERMGMPLLPWSPLADAPLPAEACGVILPGGFPEQHAEELSACRSSLTSLQTFATQRPVYAECGGMLLLGRTLEDLDAAHAMADVLLFNAGTAGCRWAGNPAAPSGWRCHPNGRHPPGSRISPLEPGVGTGSSSGDHWEIHGCEQNSGTRDESSDASRQLGPPALGQLYDRSRWRAALATVPASWTDASSNARPRDCRPMPNAGN